MEEVAVKNLWNGQPCSEPPVQYQLCRSQAGLEVKIHAPFYDDPPPPDAKRGEAYYQLWDYEVVELFFLNAESKRYLELEFGPHGQHLALLLNGGPGQCIQHSLPLEYTCEIDEKTQTWRGHCQIPKDYFPPDVNKFNAYSIHGRTTDERVYRSLYPVPGTSADFHRLEYFQPFDGQRLIGQSGLSEMWRKALQTK